jgi:hypothetical protein
MSTDVSIHDFKRFELFKFKIVNDLTRVGTHVK